MHIIDLLYLPTVRTCEQDLWIMCAIYADRQRLRKTRFTRPILMNVIEFLWNISFQSSVPGEDNGFPFGEPCVVDDISSELAW